MDRKIEENNTITKKVISKDHIILEKPCGCKLHVFIGDSFEELCGNCGKKFKHFENDD